MAAEGMVHALSLIHELLKPGGFLIDLHPGKEKPEFSVLFPDGSRFVGHLEETDDFVEYAQAQSALERVVSDGLYRLEHAGEFPFVSHAARFAEMEAFLAENWKDAVLTSALRAEAAAAFRLPGAQEIQLVERVAIARLRRVDQGAPKSMVK